MGHHLKTGPGLRPWTWKKPKETDHLKNGQVRKIEPQVLKTLSFVSSHMKEYIEVIHFHIKSRGVSGLTFAQITFKKYTII